MKGVGIVTRAAARTHLRVAGSAWLGGLVLVTAVLGGCGRSVDDIQPGDCIGALTNVKIVDCASSEATWRLVNKDGPSGLNCPPDTDVLQTTPRKAGDLMEWWCVQSPTAPWPRATPGASAPLAS
jgi:hypothetical protein